jgi:hypothetical protein
VRKHSSNRQKQLAALQAAAENKKQNAFNRASDAIRRLALMNQKLSFALVAQEAGLSIAYLYKNEDLKRRIQTLRRQKEDRLTARQQERKAGDDAHKVIVKQLKEKIQELEAEKVAQKREIEALAGQLYELTIEKENVTRIKRENGRLREQLTAVENTNAQSTLVPFPSGSSKIIQTTLAELKVKPSASLRRVLSSYPEERIINALKALREAIGSGAVRSPTGFFIKALKEGWEPNDLSSMTEHDRKQFTRWFNVARSKGLVQVSRGTEGGIMVLKTDGKWALWSELMSKKKWQFKELSS